MSDALSAVESQFAAYNKHDLAAFVANFSDDFVAYRMPSTEPSIVGKTQLSEFYANHRFNQPALRAELISRTLLGNKVFDFERIHGLSEQPIESMAVFAVNNGVIDTAWFYFS